MSKDPVNDPTLVATSQRFGLHPGHVLLTSALPLLALAYRDYRTPLENVLHGVLKRQRVTITDLPAAEESTRRAIAVAVASRALRVATLCSCGTFSLVTACAFYVSDCKSLDQAILQTQQWAFRTRSRLDAALGISSTRVDVNHPEMQAIQGMNEQEEFSHISQTYLSDWDSSDNSHKQNSR